MKKYGKDSFYVEEIEEVENFELDEKEKFYIKKFNSVTPNGYNILDGGSLFENDNPMFHEEIRGKVSNKLKGENNPAKRSEVKEKIRDKALNKKVSDETRKKMSENNSRYWKDKKLSKETCKKISENHGCKGKFGGLNPASRKVSCFDLKTNEEIKTFESIVEAMQWLKDNSPNKDFNIKGTGISQNIHGKQKSAYGYKWKIVEKV